MTEDIDGNAAKKVEILSSRNIPNIDTITMIEYDFIAVEYGKIILRIRLEYLLLRFAHIHSYTAYRTTCVPTPVDVKISRMMACGRRPSMMCVFAAPHSSAVRHASTLGIIPPEMMPSRM